MNLDEYWQENRRFVLQVGGGALAFVIGLLVVDAVFGGELRDAQTALRRAEQRASQATYSSADEDVARADHESLRAAVAELEARVDFRPRPGFRPAQGAVTAGRYLDAVANVRDGLLPLARRRGMVLDPSLGLPEQSPTREEELSRQLDALDVVDRVARIALEEGVERIDKIRTRIDPGLFGRDGVGYVERTRVEFSASGKSAPLARLVQRLARAGDPPIAVESVLLEASRQRADEARLELSVLAPRVARAFGEAGGEARP